MRDSLVRFRRPTVADLPQIESLAEKVDYPLVQKFETAGIIENHSGITAFAVTRNILEVVIYCDGSNKEKVLGIKKLLEQAKIDARNRGHREIYAFIFDEKFADILLSRKFGFRKARGTPVILDLEE